MNLFATTDESIRDRAPLIGINTRQTGCERSRPLKDAGYRRIRPEEGPTIVERAPRKFERFAC
jgi:hypothetical protein